MLPRGLLKEHSQFLSVVLRLLDVCAVTLSGIAVYYYRFDRLTFDSHYQIAFFASMVITFFVFNSFHIYTSMRGQSFWSAIKRLLEALAIVFVLLTGLAFITKSGSYFSRAWFLLWCCASLLALMILRCGLLITLRIMRAHGLNEKRVILIGDGKLAYKLVETMQQSLWTGFRIVAIFADQPSVAEIKTIPVQVLPTDLQHYITTKQQQLDEIWLALPLQAEDRVKELLYDLRHHTIPVRFVLDIFGFGLFNHSITDLAGFPTLNINASPMTGSNRIVKALQDRILAALILLVISPLFLFIALGVKLSSKGPVIFKQLRHGWDGRIIKVYKFRTMMLHEEVEGELHQATVDDKRITRFGKFLRRTSLDELPQFLNVLQGRMSIVGPRPHALQHNEFYKDSINAYMQRHRVKPGITGWAQINGWRGETDTLDKMQKRIEYDLYYIENWSLIFDLKIIFLTFFQGFMGKNAY